MTRALHLYGPPAVDDRWRIEISISIGLHDIVVDPSQAAMRGDFVDFLAPGAAYHTEQFVIGTVVVEYSYFRGFHLCNLDGVAMQAEHICCIEEGEKVMNMW